MPKLSVCMIVKDEELFIANALHSARGADEIVVVDTGSSDDTREIASAHHAKVFDHEWKNSFAEARNRSVRESSGDFILILDADEELEKGSIEFIKSLINNYPDPYAVFQLLVTNVGNDQNAQHFTPRLFKKEKFVAFHGRLHECVVMDKEIKLYNLPEVTITHYGYQTHIVESRKKTERNLELLKLSALDSGGSEPFVFYNIAITYMSKSVSPEDDRLAIQYLELAIENTPEDSTPLWFIDAYTSLVSLYLKFGDTEIVKEKMEVAPDIVKKSPEYWILLGDLLNLSGDGEGAIECFEQASQIISCGYINPIISVRKNLIDILCGIADSHVVMNKLYKAHAGYKKVLLEDAGNQRALDAMKRIEAEIKNGKY